LIAVFTDFTPAALEGPLSAFLIAGLFAAIGIFILDDAGKFGVAFAILI
jgi:hypothetical protein